MRRIAKPLKSEPILLPPQLERTAAALERGEAEIRRIGRLLRAEGEQSYALRSLA